MFDVLSRIAKDDSGATAVEYGFIAALVSIALIAGGASLGNQIGVTLNMLTTKLSSATNR